MDNLKRGRFLTHALAHGKLEIVNANIDFITQTTIKEEKPSLGLTILRYAFQIQPWTVYFQYAPASARKSSHNRVDACGQEVVLCSQPQ